jgi:hypothetical protein
VVLNKLKIYEGRKIVLLTKHGKESVIKPILENKTGCELVTDSSFDTDRLGSFSREVKRRKSQLETARLKIKKGMRRAKTDMGIASEGSFGLHPIVPIPWNVELVLLYDKRDRFEIYGVHESSDTNFDHKTIRSMEEAVEFAEKAGFPEHYLIIRPENAKSRHIIKDINSLEKLGEAFDLCKKRSKSGNVFIETDMRAYANPTRMKNIEKATQDLLEKLLIFCPVCGAPGFTVKESLPGLPCEICGTPGDMTLKHVLECHRCNHRHEELHPKGKAAPAEYCHHCNP